ncbi:hypothetical protein Tco_0980396, partial [Tanacetum coccineum]
RRFDFPRSKDVDKVVFSHLRDKFRTLKHRIKKSLLALAAKRLHEANNFDGEMQYTDDEILQALDLVEAPHYFVDHQWESCKYHLRAPKTKQLSAHGKAKAGFANKLFEIGISERDDPEKRLEIAREVMQELRPPKKNGRPCGYGVGVTKSQVTKFSFDLRRMRRQGVSSENRFLLNKVAEQSKQIEKQSRKMNTMEENMPRFIGELKTMLPDFFATRTSKTQVEQGRKDGLSVTYDNKHKRHVIGIPSNQILLLALVLQSPNVNSLRGGIMYQKRVYSFDVEEVGLSILGYTAIVLIVGITMGNGTTMFEGLKAGEGCASLNIDL